MTSALRWCWFSIMTDVWHVTIPRCAWEMTVKVVEIVRFWILQNVLRCYVKLIWGEIPVCRLKCMFWQWNNTLRTCLRIYNATENSILRDGMVWCESIRCDFHIEWFSQFTVIMISLNILTDTDTDSFIRNRNAKVNTI